MKAAPVALPAPTVDLARWWQNAKTAAGTCVVILAVIGAVHVTEPLRADAVAVAPAKPAKAVKVVEGK